METTVLSSCVRIDGYGIITKVVKIVVSSIDQFEKPVHHLIAQPWIPTQERKVRTPTRKTGIF